MFLDKLGATKKKIIDPLNKLLNANRRAKRPLIKNSLNDLQKNMDKIRLWIKVWHKVVAM